MTQVLTGSAWRTARSEWRTGRERTKIFDILSTVFAMAALTAAVAPTIIEQATGGADAERAANTSSSRSTLSAPGREMMFAGYGGVPYTYPSDVTIRKTGVHDFIVKDVDWEGKPFVNPIYYGARIVRYGGRTGAMLDFTHSKTIAELDKEKTFTGTLDGAPAPERAILRNIFRKLEASHGHNMLTLNGLLRLPSFSVRFQPYVGLGAGVSLPHSEVQLAKSEARTYEYQMAGPVGQALFGIELRTARMSYFLEYKFTYAPYEMPLSEKDGALLPLDLWRQFRNWMSGEEPPGGRLTTTLVSHQGIFGLGVRSAPIAAP